MRSFEEIMKGLHIYYSPSTQNVFLVQDNYSHSLLLVKKTVEYAKTIGLTVPEDDQIKIEVLAGPRYKGVMSVEFKSPTPPSIEYTELTDNSPLYD